MEIEYVKMKGVRVMQAERSHVIPAAEELGLVWLVSCYADSSSTTWIVLFDTTTDEKLKELQSVLWDAGLGSVEIVEEEVEA